MVIAIAHWLDVTLTVVFGGIGAIVGVGIFVLMVVLLVQTVVQEFWTTVERLEADRLRREERLARKRKAKEAEVLERRSQDF